MEDSRNIIKAIDALTLKVGGEDADSKNITEAIDNLTNTFNLDDRANEIIPATAFESGGFDIDGTNNPDPAMALIRLRTKGFIPVEPLSVYVFSIYECSNISFAISFYENDDINSQRMSTTDWIYNYSMDSYFVTIPEGAKYVRVTLKHQDESSITVDELLAYRLFFYKDSYNITTKGIHWGNGAIFADTECVNRDAKNSIYSPYLNTGCILVPSFAEAFIKLFKNTLYIGKINANGQLDKVAGNWKTFTGAINVIDILNEYNADYLIFACRSKDVENSITQDNYRKWGRDNIGSLNSSGIITFINDITNNG